MLGPSQRGMLFTRGYEQCRLKAYLPTPQDVPTIGWGTTGPDIHLGLVWAQETADARFTQDYAWRAHATAAALESPTNQNQFDAIVDLAYNEGVHAVLTSTLLRLHNAGDYEGAANEFKRWIYQKSKVVSGLVMRRAADAALYRASPAEQSS